MNLVTLRQKFAQLTGRYDLVDDTTSWGDNGADFYINAGQEFLDRRSNVWRKTNRIFDQLAAGVWYKTFTRCRIIEAVYINNTTGRSKLERKDFHWLHEEFSDTVATEGNGTPLYYCPAYLKSTESTDITSLGAFFNYVMASSAAYRGVIILPPPDESIVIEVIGQFYSEELSLDADENFWTINHPGLLLLAAMYQLEVLAHRNTEGANDYLRQLDIAPVDLDKDMADEESNSFTQMEG